MWGANPGRDGYGLYNMASYYLLFMVVATHLKTRAQLWRLLIVIAAAAAMISLYGLLQHHRIDLLLGPPRQSRITATFGNALFAASFLVMTISLTMGAALAHNVKKSLHPSGRGSG